MKRRHFLASTCAMGVASMLPTAIANQNDERDYYELRKYLIDTQEQKDRLNAFLRDAAIPAYNRIGVNPVGVFYPEEGGLSPIYVMLRYNSIEDFATATSKLMADSKFLTDGADVLDTPQSNPAYARIENQLMVAFTGMPKLDVVSTADTRVFEMRKYESHSVKTGQKKIEMFNVDEIKVFLDAGRKPVFFGESLIDSLMPNLTYMVGADNREQLDADAQSFSRSEAWQNLRSLPKYANIITNMHSTYLVPAPYSQI